MINNNNVETENYERLSLKITPFDQEDVITTSGVFVYGDDDDSDTPFIPNIPFGI